MVARRVSRTSRLRCPSLMEHLIGKSHRFADYIYDYDKAKWFV
jgi:hypothetical protein